MNARITVRRAAQRALQYVAHYFKPLQILRAVMTEDFGQATKWNQTFYVCVSYGPTRIDCFVRFDQESESQ